MQMHFDSLQISIPDWLILLLALMFFASSVLNIISSIYRFKAQSLKAKIARSAPTSSKVDN